MELKDKRIDKLLREKGYQDPEVFYGPISIWLITFCGYIFAPALGLLLGLIMTPWILLLLPYFFIAYLTNAWHCCCFALVEGKCCVINPNWPFRKFEVIAFDDIESVSIDKQHPGWKSFFTLFGSNYIEIHTGNDKKRFYCAYLELDAYDENMTEKTIEDFQYALECAGIPVQMNLQYNQGAT